MRASRFMWVVLMAMLAAVGYWYWQSLQLPASAPAQNALAHTINECDLIASKAAAALPEQLPFQKLEKAARQSRVLEHCMQDRGYQENPDWVVAANKQAKAMASAQGISDSEAYETLRRKAMLQSDQQPGYWRKRP